MKPLVIEKLEEMGVKTYHTGSRAIMDHPPETSDDDWIVLNDPCVMDVLDEYGYTPKSGNGTSGGSGSQPWYSSDGMVNVILCFSTENFRKWMTATDEAKRLKLTDRADRITLFKLYRVDDDPNHEEIPF